MLHISREFSSAGASLVQSVEAVYQSDSRHTIFSIDRYLELLDRVENADVIIAGCGTKSQITSAATKANSILWEIKEVKGPLYYHPFL